MDNEQQIVDYSAHFKDAVMAQGRGTEFLCLTKLDRPFVRADGKKALYQIENRWLSKECREENDGAYACCRGQDFTYWQHVEIRSLLRKIREGKDVNLFEQFRLF